MAWLYSDLLAEVDGSEYFELFLEAAPFDRNGRGQVKVSLGRYDGRGALPMGVYMAFSVAEQTAYETQKVVTLFVDLRNESFPQGACLAVRTFKPKPPEPEDQSFEALPFFEPLVQLTFPDLAYAVSQELNSFHTKRETMRRRYVSLVASGVTRLEAVTEAWERRDEE